MKLVCWALLLVLLAATLAGALTFDRRSWPSVVGDEATYLMAAQSLAFDHDLRYSRADYRRFVAQWGVPPDGLILQSPDGGKTLVYAKPAAYPLFIAPFVRLLPARGPWIANALLLAVAAVAVALALRGRLGAAAPLWVAAWVFASVAFAYVFWAHEDLFLACLVAVALALVYGTGEAPRRPWLRWAAAGVLLGVVVLSRPLYLPIVVPAVLAAPRPLRRRAGLALAVGMVGVVVASTAASLLVRRDWSSYVGERRAFYAYTGFPKVDAAAGDWRHQIDVRRNSDWVKPETLQVGFDARQTAWNVVYYLIGRHVGVLPYFLPLLLGLLALASGEGRWALPLAAIAAALALFWLRPFNFYGGGGSIANRYFLPVYPALWFLAARHLRGWRAWVPPLAAAAFAAPFLWPLWVSPRAFPIAKDGGYRWASPQARAWLPYETTLSHLKPAGEEDLHQNGLWVKLLTPGLKPVRGGAALSLTAGTRGEVLVGSAQPLAAVRVLMAPGTQLSVPGALPAVAPGAVGWRVAFRHPRAVHRMWWTDDPFYLYAVELVPPAQGAPVTFHLEGEPRAVAEAHGGLG